METKTNSWIGNFIVGNIKSIFTGIIFVCGLYIQHQAAMIKIEHLEQELTQVKMQLDAHYAKLDNVKLDKAVFEATMRQFTDMSADIRQIRDIIEGKHGEYHGKDR